MKQPRLDVYHISFQYKGTTFSLENVSFQVAAGEAVAIILPSGGGKSTLMRLCASLIPPHEGSIILNGVDIHHGPYKKRQDVISRQGVIFQNGGMVENASVFENLTLALRYHSRLDEEKLSAVGSLAQELDLLDHIRERPSLLSYSQRLCAQFARALASDPDILFLDDPVIPRIKPDNAKNLLRMIKERQEKHGMSMVAFSSNPKDIADLIPENRLIHLETR